MVITPLCSRRRRVSRRNILRCLLVGGDVSHVAIFCVASYLCAAKV